MSLDLEAACHRIRHLVSSGELMAARVEVQTMQAVVVSQDRVVYFGLFGTRHVVPKKAAVNQMSDKL